MCRGLTGKTNKGTMILNNECTRTMNVNNEQWMIEWILESDK